MKIQSMNKKLENGRFTPRCLTVVCNTTVSTKKTRRTLMK